ncbi:hypothetical protein IBX73_11995 [candidate division WOR-3 bacterium]|nr:hypothetical protein [candidate division WOR-3 bacterium]
MKKPLVVLLVTMVLSFSYGLQPSFNLGLGWSYLKPEGYDGSHFLGIGVGTIAPYSKYVGLMASVFWVQFDLSEEGTILGISSRVGFIEMIPNRYASPFFTQSITLDHIAGGGLSYTAFGLGIGLGIEFLSRSNIRPYMAGSFAYASTSMDGLSSSAIGLGAGGGVRFSW